MKKKYFFLKILMYYIQKISFSLKQPSVLFLLGFWEKMASLSFLEYF